MTRLRAALNLLVGLVLLVQGFAVAAAPLAAVSDNGSVQTTAATSAMPCHGDQTPDGPAHPSCCDEACPDMTSCALGHLAVTPLLRLEVAAPSHDFIAATVPVPATFTPQSRLRPPIVLFA
jgi:hypothetical protein